MLGQRERRCAHALALVGMRLPGGQPGGRADIRQRPLPVALDGLVDVRAQLGDTAVDFERAGLQRVFGIAPCERALRHKAGKLQTGHFGNRYLRGLLHQAAPGRSVGNGDQRFSRHRVNHRGGIGATPGLREQLLRECLPGAGKLQGAFRKNGVRRAHGDIDAGLQRQLTGADGLGEPIAAEDIVLIAGRFQHDQVHNTFLFEDDNDNNRYPCLPIKISVLNHFKTAGAEAATLQGRGRALIQRGQPLP